MPKSFVSSLAPLLQLIFSGRRSFFLFSLIVLLNAFAALLEGLSFTWILFALAALGGEIGTLQAAAPSFLQKFLDFFPQEKAFVLFFVFAICFQLLRSSIHYVAQIKATQLATHLQTNSLKKVYRQIFRLSYSCVSHYKIGDLVDYANAPLNFLSLVTDAFNRLCVAFLLMIACLGLMLWIAPQLTFLNMSLFALAGISQHLIMKKIMTISGKHSETIVELNKETVQSLYGIKAIHCFNGQKGTLSKIEKTLQKIAAATQKMHLWSHFILPFNEMIGVIVVGISLATGSWLLKGSALPFFPVLLTFLTLAYRFSTRVQIFMFSFGVISTHRGQFDRLNEILTDEGKEFEPVGGKVIEDFQDNIEFKQVFLNYPGRKKWVLQDLSFTIEKGSVTALVGHSGAGKTSVLEILARLYEPSLGVVSVDGVDMKDFSVRSWRKMLGIVSQDVFILNGTVGDNIRFGDESMSREKLEDAARLAHIHEMVMNLPEQYETIVGERGYRLSGGEKQRIALARALARDPEILVLDEATSNLDSEGERLIQEALEHFRGKKTLIVVAHRLSTISQADQILVLDKGKLIEKGTHADLLQVGGRYQVFWNLQTVHK